MAWLSWPSWRGSWSVARSAGTWRRVDGAGLAGPDGVPGQSCAQEPAGAGHDGVRVGHGAVVDRGLDRTVPDGALAQAGGRGDVRAAAGAGSGDRRGLVCTAESDWLDWGGTITFWGTVHGIFLLGGAVFTCVAFFAGLMYLVQMRRLKAKRPSRFGLALPSLEQSERINRGAITIAFPLLTFGLLIGMVLSVAARAEENAPARRHIRCGGPIPRS